MSEASTELVLQLEQPLADDDWAHKFFHAYLSSHGRGTISRSAKYAGVHVEAVRRRRANDAIFAALFHQADEILLEALEAESYRRAKDGTLRPIFQAGQRVGFVRDVDNRHLEWLLERLAPEKYHLPTKIELTNPAGGKDRAFTFTMGDRELEQAEDAQTTDLPD